MSIWTQGFRRKRIEPLQNLFRQKRMIEQRGCFSDQELDEKYDELDAIEQRIKEVKHSQFQHRKRGA